MILKIIDSLTGTFNQSIHPRLFLCRLQIQKISNSTVYFKGHFKFDLRPIEIILNSHKNLILQSNIL